MAQDFSLIFELHERRHRVGDGRGRLLPVRLIEVDVRGLQPHQAALQFLANRLRAKELVDLLFRGANGDARRVSVEMELALLAVPNQAAFRGQHDLLAPIADRPADDLLRSSKTVDRSGVDQVDAAIEGGMNRGDGLVFVGAAPHPAANCPGAETNRRDVDFR